MNAQMLAHMWQLGRLNRLGCLGRPGRSGRLGRIGRFGRIGWLVYPVRKKKDPPIELKGLELVKKTLFNGGCFLPGENGFGMNELLGIAAALIIAAFVVIPGLRGFASTVIEELGEWWNTFAGKIFADG